MPSNFKALAGASGGEPTDANFKNVTLLLHGDGSNGAQNNTFIDSSTNNFTITRNGNTTQGSFSPYGSNWSNYFDGSGDYLSAPSNAAFDCGTGDWTIECWVYISTRTNSYPVIFGNNRGSWTTDALALTNSNADSGGIYADRFVFGWNNGGFSSVSYGTSQLLVANATNSNNTWYHFAVVRNGTSIKMYRNGVEVASATISSGASFNWGYNGALVGGGNWDGAGSYFNGYISNLRVLKGTALYTSTFTPSTTPLTAITNTSLLTCADNRFRDGSTNNFTITRNGDVKVTNFSPFAPSAAYSTSANGGSGYFDGTDDHLTVASNAAFAFGTGDFTIECWVYVANTSSQMIFVDLRGASSSTTAPLIYMTSSGVVNYYTNGGVQITGTGISANSWNHLAVARSGTSTKLFINGTQAGSTYSDSNNYVQSSVYIGRASDAAGSFVTGYMSNVRILKGTAVYTAAFTPPTAPVTAITNTSLLCNFTNAAIFDNSMKNDLETVGNAQISTSVKKFGTGSMAFDGSGDQLSIPSSDALSLGTGNFTIELWMYHGTGAYVNSQPVLVQNWSTTWAANYWSFHADHSSGTAGKFTLWVHNFNSGSSPMLTSTSTSKTSTWNHVAIVRNGNSFAMYVNGVSEATATFSGSMDGGGTWPIYIGGPGQAYDGYIDDLRITKGVARYTANFTAPTAPFPNK